MTYLSRKLSTENNSTKYDSERSVGQFSSSHQNLEHYFFSFFHCSKINFVVEMVKERNFLDVVDLSFDARFLKYSQFSLQYHKKYPINNIKVKLLQIGQNVSDIFWTCSLQIVSDKLRGFLISSFWSCDSDFWWWQQISQMNRNWLIYARFNSLKILWFIQRC